MVTDLMCCIFQVSPPSIIGSIQNCCNGSTAHRRSKYLDIPAANSAATPKTRWDLSCPPSDGVDDLVSKMKVSTLRKNTIVVQGLDFRVAHPFAFAVAVTVFGGGCAYPD